MGHTQGTLPAPGLYRQHTAPGLLGVSTAPSHSISQSEAWARARAHSSALARHCWVPFQGPEPTHTCWLALWGLLPADPGCGKHHFLHIPSLTHQASSQNTPITLVSSLPASCSLTVSHLRLLTTSHLSLCWLCPLDSKSHPPLGWLVFMWQPVPALSV